MTVHEVLSNVEHFTDGSPFGARTVPSSALHPPEPQQGDAEAAEAGISYHVDEDSGRTEHLYVLVLHPPKELLY